MESYDKQFSALKKIMKDIQDSLLQLNAERKLNLHDYKGIKTAMHIVENNDRQGIKNIAKYLSDDARMIYDNQTGNEKLYCQIDLACEISRNLYNHFLH